MSDALKLLTPWVAIITTVLAGYWTFKNQLRLKSFELLLNRRNDVLKLVEMRMAFYRLVLNDLDTEPPNLKSETCKLFLNNSFHDTLILYHKAKGVCLGPVAELFINSYWKTCAEAAFKGDVTPAEARKSVVHRLNDLAAFYGCAHSRISTEIESFSLSYFNKLKRLLGIKEKLKVGRAPTNKVGGKRLKLCSCTPGST